MKVSTATATSAKEDARGSLIAVTVPNYKAHTTEVNVRIAAIASESAVAISATMETAATAVAAALTTV